MLNKTEEFLLMSDFLDLELKPSKITGKKEMMVKFKCPGCKDLRDPPKEGSVFICGKCDTRVDVMGNGILKCYQYSKS